MAGGIDAERAEELTAATMERQNVLSRPDPPEVIAVLHELVLHRLIGSPVVMADQLGHLAELADRPNISVHVVPSSVGAHAGLSGDIALASGDGGLLMSCIPTPYRRGTRQRRDPWCAVRR